MSVAAFLDELVTSGTATGAVALAGNADRIEWEIAAGEARPGRAAGPETRFDFASLTKPFTATLALVLDAEGVLPVAARIGDVWPEAHRDLARRTLSDLLRHRSGLAGWTPLYHRCRSLNDVLPLLLGGELLGTRRGTYSDLDFILYGLAAEKVTGAPLAALVRSRVLVPLGLADVVPATGDQPDIAESRMDTDKEVELAARQGLAIAPLGAPPVGWPQDGNARFVNGLAGLGTLVGNAGLFGRARDLWRLGAEWLRPGFLLKPEAVAAALEGGGPFALGWWRRTLRGSAGRALPPASFGHTGFAGGSLWIDPEERRVLVLLSHRTEPSCDMNRWRRRFHEVARPIDSK